MRATRPGLGAGWLTVGVPYAWLLVLFLAPFAIVAGISVGESAIGIPPYTPPLSFAEGPVPAFNINLGNYGLLLGDSLYIRAYLNSLALAGGATLLCLLLGYPMAYAIALAPSRWRIPLPMLIVLPFWTSFLIRVYAWIGILNTNGLINNLLLATGLVDQPLPHLNNLFSVELALVYSYLPFMVLPLYATLERMDPALLEAAADLGGRPLSAFLAVTLPLSLPGIAAGCLLVFIPAVGEFVIPDLLGGPDTLMIGKVLWDEFFTNRDWPLASAVAIAMLVLLVAPIALVQRALGHGEAAG
jgi:putrescine transport system permease protein